MELGKKKKSELLEVCKELGIEASNSDKKEELINKIESFSTNNEPHDVDDVETISKDVVDETPIKIEIEEVKQDGKVLASYKSKQRWIDLGEFESKEKALRKLSKLGAKIFSIKPN